MGRQWKSYNFMIKVWSESNLEVTQQKWLIRHFLVFGKFGSKFEISFHCRIGCLKATDKRLKYVEDNATLSYRPKVGEKITKTKCWVSMLKISSFWESFLDNFFVSWRIGSCDMSFCQEFHYLSRGVWCFSNPSLVLKLHSWNCAIFQKKILMKFYKMAF